MLLNAVNTSRIFFLLLLMGITASSFAQDKALVVADDGNIGMGLDVPLSPLHMLQNTGNAGEMIRFENNGGSYLTFLHNGTGNSWFFVHENNSVAPDGRRFLITHNTQSGPSMSLSPGGNLVIAGDLTTATQTIPDYVFSPDYTLMSLEDVEAFINTHHHLPKVQSDAEVKAAGGINISKMQLQVLEKVEELFLHTIEQQKQIEQLESRNNKLIGTISQLENRLAAIEDTDSN